MHPARRLAATVALGAALVAGAACGGGGDDPVSRDELTTELRNDAGVTEAQASCMADDLFERLDQDDIDAIAGYTGDTDDEVSDEAVAALTDAITTCVATDDDGSDADQPDGG
ncbi:hypothetical protein PO878_15665 [Iamia majanohamensis]|uniref:Uncharacterized protein n=1 Tax=Iamia majanohamensis TaxID=467976 RepID=A0AAE9Y4G6_9ACTN|nr:hypothetical protein [Iamia majanohamensis]WCO65940.1 hypothetical protein PO878_15665 [Iamia majanohamensis]